MTILQIRTQEELDTIAAALAEAWGKSFAPGPKFDGKKKNALRDVVLRLAGYPNGYQQWKAHQLDAGMTNEPQEKPASMATNEWTTRFKELPSTLLVIADAHDLSSLLLLGVPHPDNDLVMGHLLYQMSDANMPDGDQWRDSTKITDVPLWASLIACYAVSSVDIEMPSIRNYGIPDVATERGALEFIEELGLKLQPDRYLDITPHDRGDDGSAQVFITLTAI